MINSAISGMMESLDDPYSMYFDKEETDNFSISLNGSYEGVGIQIMKDSETGYMLITSIFKDSPAAESGLKAGDMIVSIDGKDSKDLTASEFSSIVKEGKKTNYKLKVLRNEEEIEKEFIDSNYGNFKTRVADIVIDELTKIQTKYNEILNSDILEEILKNNQFDLQIWILLFYLMYNPPLLYPHNL